MTTAKSSFILTLDQGTTSSRAMLVNKQGEIVSIAQREFQQHYPKPGWVEHSPEDIWQSQINVAYEAVSNASIEVQSVAAIGITNQRETTIIWNRETGDPVYPAIVWQDRRTADICSNLLEQGQRDYIHKKTGLIIDPYFSASKIKWILENVPDTRSLANKGKLAFGTVDTFLLWRLSGGKVHLTDVSNASRTMLFNIHTLDWDDDILDLLDIPRSILPEVRSSSEIFTNTVDKLQIANVPIAGIAGDQQAALFGQMCTKPGMVKNTYGTGAFMVMNTGEKPITSDNNLLTTIAWKIGNNVQYALEGSVFVAGAVVQWLRDNLGIISSSDEVEQLASTVEENGGVYLVPAFTGLGAPHWDPDARGTIVGLTRGSNAGHIARAALESIAFQVNDLLTAMKADSGLEIDGLRVDGGAASNDLLMQFQSDISGSRLIRPENQETTALGAAYLAGLGVGFWENIEEIQGFWRIEKEFSPASTRKETEDLLKNWKNAVGRSKNWSS